VSHQWHESENVGREICDRTLAGAIGAHSL
jgi:hypothetical protein